MCTQLHSSRSNNINNKNKSKINNIVYVYIRNLHNNNKAGYVSSHNFTTTIYICLS